MRHRRSYSNEETIDRFMKKVYPEPNTGCWLWSGACTKFGHGTLNGKNHSGINFAHRYSFLIHKGAFDNSCLVLHTCDNPSCVNPDHLYIGDYVKNNQDRDSRGRRKKFKGADNGNSILNQDQVNEIRMNYKFRCPKNNMYRLAERYSVSQSTINAILNGKNWN